MLSFFFPWDLSNLSPFKGGAPVISVMLFLLDFLLKKSGMCLHEYGNMMIV